LSFCPLLYGRFYQPQTVTHSSLLYKPLQSHSIDYVDKYVHLDHVIAANLNDMDDIER